MLRIHPSFRIIALAEPPGSGDTPWLNPEVLSLFLFHQMPAVTQDQELHIMQQMFGRVPLSVAEVVRVTHTLRESADATLQSLASSLTTRQLLRVARRAAAYPGQSAHSIVQQACLANNFTLFLVVCERVVVGKARRRAKSYSTVCAHVVRFPPGCVDKQDTVYKVLLAFLLAIQAKSNAF
ncbi:von Willebrand factor A domain-containing protein 8 [Homalodisca vitripennis]|nr:von Willebrand factor A domain-containing protein 8 [Homalodisca vitripennis]